MKTRETRETESGQKISSLVQFIGKGSKRNVDQNVFFLSSFFLNLFRVSHTANCTQKKPKTDSCKPIDDFQAETKKWI